MATYSGLVEYLLAVRAPGSRSPLCRLGQHTTRIDTFPPNFSVSFTTAPSLGSYAAILYKGSWSPNMVPDAFYYEAYQLGIEFGGISLSALPLDGFINVWLILTEAAPATTTVTNLTPLLQYYEGSNEYILIDSEPTFQEVLEIIKRWCAEI